MFMANMFKNSQCKNNLTQIGVTKQKHSKHHFLKSVKINI